jgi:Zn-finger nucleic acid-binding protein
VRIYALVGAAMSAANCDVCDSRPGVRSVLAYGIETWVCDLCSGVELDSKRVEHMIKAVDTVMQSWKLERIKRELHDCMLHERATTGVDRRHWTEKTVIGDDNDK